VIQTAGLLGLLALLSLFLPFIYRSEQVAFVSFLIWVAALGGVGSIAFIGMNALAVQDDATFDITNTKLIALRIALGALFGAVLTLPVGYPSFLAFLNELTGDKTRPMR
jgi:predicted MFS family arabinose efflux permease